MKKKPTFLDEYPDDLEEDFKDEVSYFPDVHAKTIICEEYTMVETNEYGYGVEIKLTPIPETGYIDFNVTHLMREEPNEDNSAGVTLTADAIDRLIQHLVTASRVARLG